MATKKSDQNAPKSTNSKSGATKKSSKTTSAKKSAPAKSAPAKSPSLHKFQIVHVEGAIYGVLFDGQPLLTSLGGRHPVRHSSYRFLEHLVIELSERGELVVEDGVVVSPLGFDSYSLLGLQRERITSKTDNFSTGLVGELVCDGTLEQPPIDIYAQQVGYYMPVQDWLAALGARLVDLDFVDLDKIDGIPEGYWRINSGMGDEYTADFLELIRVLTAVFEQLSPQQRSAAVYLSNITGHSPIFSICLAVGGCSAQEFGAGVAARHAGGISDRSLKNAAKEREVAATKALRFIELASGEIQRPARVEETI
jgi:hypothetical protein